MLTTASDTVSWPLAQNSGHSLGGPVAPNDEGNVEPLSEIGILSVSVQVLRLQIVSKCVPDFVQLILFHADVSHLIWTEKGLLFNH